MSEVDVTKLTERLNRRLSKSDDCWLWIGCRNKDGYGSIRVGKTTLLTHRVAWEIANGEIPAGMIVCHRCDTPPCCNPSHLFVGYQRDNIKDCIQKGRFPSVVGKANPRCRLTEESVREIRSKGKLGATYRSLAKEYRVSLGAICGIMSRKNWKHVT